MPFYQVKPFYVSAVRYEKGMEDGFIKVFDAENKNPERPYVNTIHGKRTIYEGDYIVTKDGKDFEVYSEEALLEKFVIVEVGKRSIHKLCGKCEKEKP